MIEEGKKAPAFALKDKDGKVHRLNGVEADFTVLFFYPKDNTPGCTIEAKSFSADVKKFQRQGAELIGISGGDEKTKEKFCNKHDLNVLLLSDSDFEVSKKYGVFGKKSFMGKTFQGIHRRTFVLDKTKKVIKVFEKVKPAVHSQEVLAFLESQ